ncbi:hypothetical protein LY76DRAFT_56920 [Colletotrichum caudatum]|nr:hypothetical protein LY76DRAFT_56920 [Colletotrichum caudatum]
MELKAFRFFLLPMTWPSTGPGYRASGGCGDDDDDGKSWHVTAGIYRKHARQSMFSVPKRSAAYQPRRILQISTAKASPSRDPEPPPPPIQRKFYSLSWIRHVGDTRELRTGRRGPPPSGPNHMQPTPARGLDQGRPSIKTDGKGAGELGHGCARVALKTPARPLRVERRAAGRPEGTAAFRALGLWWGSVNGRPGASAGFPEPVSVRSRQQHVGVCLTRDFVPIGMRWQVNRSTSAAPLTINII